MGTTRPGAAVVLRWYGLFFTGPPPARYRSSVLWFAILQVLDLATTLVGFRVGATEASPFVRLLMGLGPATGVAVSKAVAILLAVVCIRSGHGRVVHWVNFWYAGLFFWNAFVIAAIAWRNGGF